ncbi:MAG: DUF1801 domain-containing protein [Candidatus Acidiferrum sp.]
MRKIKSGPSLTGSKRTAAPETVDEYLDSVPEPARSTLEKLRTGIRAAVPVGAVETISYRIPAFKYKKVLVWYAAFADHCSLFPTASIIERFKSELKGFTTSKGTIQFPVDKPLPAALVRKMIKARVREAAGTGGGSRRRV